MKFLRPALVVGSILLFGLAVTGAEFRDGEGFLAGRAAFPIAAAAALFILAFTLRTSVTRTGGWVALGLLGQAAAAQLIDAGATVRYQHYAPLELQLSQDRIGFLAILAVQAVICAIAVMRLSPLRRRRVGRAFSAWKMLSLAIVFVAGSAALSRSLSTYAFELIFATSVQVMALITAGMAAMALPNSALDYLARRASNFLGAESSESDSDPGEHDRFPFVPALMVTVAAALLSVVSYERHPHIPDEVAYLLNAKYFAAGMLYMPAPPVPNAFDVDLMQLTSTEWFSSMPPGWPLILAAGERLHLAWMVNPLLAGINVILAYLFLREVYPKRTARLSIVLLCVSPWYVFMGMNFMTHMFSLTAALGGAIAVARLMRTGNLLWAWVGGGAIGVLSLTRPLEGLLLAILLALWALMSGTSHHRLLGTLFLATGSAAVGALVLPYNKALTGRMTEFPLTAYVSAHYGRGSNDLGFGANRGWGWTGLDPFPGHDAVDAAINAALNLFAVNVELFGWAAGSLVFVLALFSGRLRAADYKMLAVIVGVLCVQSFYWFSGGPDFGARYWFLMIIPLIALTVRGIEETGNLGAHDSQGLALRRTRALALGLILSATALATFFPWRAIDKYHHYRGMRPDVRELAKRHSFGRSLVLIQGKRHPDFASAAPYNPVHLDADAPVYAWARDPQIAAQAMAAFPKRRVWILQGPSITGDGFKVAHRPTADSLLRP